MEIELWYQSRHTNYAKMAEGFGAFRRVEKPEDLEKAYLKH